MTLGTLLKPFRTEQLSWYFPRAFFPYPRQPEGMPGFHRFMRLFCDMESRGVWDRRQEEALLDELRQDGAMRDDLDLAEDYHVHYRNRINAARKLGFVDTHNRSTEVGRFFAAAPQAKWTEVIEHQLVRWQFTNPSLPPQYAGFRIFPYLFTLSVLLDLEGGFITLDEFVLRVSLAKSEDERDEVVAWVREFRSLTESDKAQAKAQIDLMRSYAGRVLMLLFANTPSLSFVDNSLVVADREHAQLALGRAWPRAVYRTYSLTEWENTYGQFDKALWPLVPRKFQAKKKAYRKYVRREGGVEHKQLKRHLIENAEAIFGKGVRLVREEYYFPSSDRANLAFSFPDGRWLTVEVEVVTPQGDIVGLLQSVKYKYMCAVQEGLDFDQVTTALVARTIPEDVKEMCKRYGILAYEVKQQS